MAKILNLETATTNCSVSVSVGGEVISLLEENSANYSHAEQLHVFIDKALKNASFSFSDLDAVAVSKGPGSYTGLRIGVSAAKGLCYALNLPLISIATLKSMANQLNLKKDEVAIPVLDARRMEVYAAVYDNKLKAIRETRAEVIDENSFKEYSEAKKVHVFGSGAEKCAEVLSGHQNFVFLNGIVPSAKEMAKLSFEKYETNDFEDVAYFEPYYLKDFILQKKKN